MQQKYSEIDKSTKCSFLVVVKVLKVSGGLSFVADSRTPGATKWSDSKSGGTGLWGLMLKVRQVWPQAQVPNLVHLEP